MDYSVPISDLSWFRKWLLFRQMFACGAASVRHTRTPSAEQLYQKGTKSSTATAVGIRFGSAAAYECVVM